MIQRCRFLLIPVCLLAFSGSAAAQLTQAKDDRIIFGHLHMHPSDLDAHKQFWIETLGGLAITFGGSIEAVKFPVELANRPTTGLGHTINLTSSTYTTMPTGGTKTTTVNHVGFGVPDLSAVVARVRAAGYPIVTRAELQPEFAKDEKDGIAFRADHNARVALVMGPDDVLVELVEVPSQTVPFAMHHIHFASPNAAEMAAWYEKVFGAKRGATGSSEAVLPLATLTFEATTAPVVGTKGRSLDHIGFEVRDLESFAKELQEMGITLDRPYMEANLPDLGPIGVVFLTDPWGTYIELNEGYRAQ